MKVKYAYYRKLNVEFLAELPVSYWRKDIYRRYFKALVAPVTEFSLNNAANVAVFEIASWLVRVLLLPVIPLLVELSARSEFNEYKVYAIADKSLFGRDVSLNNIEIPSHWPKPQAWEVAE